jgi:chromosome segregation ATPase
LDTLALASAQTGKSKAEERLKLMDSELQGHVARADKALNLAKDQLLKARDEANELAAACADSKAAHNRAEKAHGAQLLSLEDARKREIARYEQKIVALQAQTEHETERNAKLNSLYMTSLQRPEELQSRCSLLQMQVASWRISAPKTVNLKSRSPSIFNIKRPKNELLLRISAPKTV